MNRRLLVAALVALSGFCHVALGGEAPARGTLVFDVKPFTSEIELKPKIEAQLKSGGLEWGVGNGKLVIAIMNKRFLKFDVAYFTRYGEAKTVELDPGIYHVDCAGFIPEGGFSVEKALSKGGYFNLDKMTFEIKAGETTTLEVLPVIRKESAFFVKFFMPQVQIKVAGSPDAGVVVNERSEQSIAYDDYHGELKFQP
jgi:hypothetical protein